LPNPENRVQLSKTFTDGVGIPRPEVTYGLDGYTLEGLISAERATNEIFKASGIENKTRTRTDDGYPSVPYFDAFGNRKHFNVFGAGHIVGTCRMGNDPKDSVVTPEMQSHDHKNLFIIGSSVFPTIATGNPTLTIAALTYRASRKLASLL
jgi:choline dehydrogenase-like flavoprotein